MKYVTRIILVALICTMLIVVFGCSSMPVTEAYWEKKWQEMSEADKRVYQEYGQRTGLPIAICDLTDCIFVWVY